MSFWTELEVQENAEHVVAVIPTVYTNKDDADAKHYTVLAAAAKSALPYHASFILSDGGLVTDQKIYDRRAVVEAQEG